LAEQIDISESKPTNKSLWQYIKEDKYVHDMVYTILIDILIALIYLFAFYLLKKLCRDTKASSSPVDPIKQAIDKEIEG
jgi:hypothetical protein